MINKQNIPASGLQKLKMNKDISLMKGSHILYTFTSEVAYLENILQFISDGIDLGQIVICLDRKDRFITVKDKLRDKGYSLKQIESIIFKDSREFYKFHQVANNKVVTESFINFINPHLKEDIPLRVWTNVEWEDQEHIYEMIEEHEKFSDDYIKGVNCLTICTYDGNRLPASELLKLMESHQYIMTDSRLAKSSLYIHSTDYPRIFIGKALEDSFQKLQTYKGELSRLEKLNVIGQMSASISHEVRNPMTTVRGFLQLLSQKEGCLEYGDYFNLMIEELDRANYIITEFLSLNKDIHPQFELANINDIINAILPLLVSDAIRRDVDLKTELQDISPIALVPQEIRQVILNLVQNGLEVTPKGKALTIRTYSEEEGVFLEIEDQGPGIPDEVMDKIGTPFFTTKKHGTGLGLSVCHRIIANHNASMEFHTSPKGTVFKINFSHPLSCKIIS